MRTDDLFAETGTRDPWGTPQVALDADLVASLRAGPLEGEDDLSAAIALTRLAHDEFEAYGTSGGERLTEDQIELVQRSLRATLERHDITLNLPWRNFSSLRTYWVQNDCKGSWQARRDLLGKFFGPVRDELDRLEEVQFRAVLAEAVSPHEGTGWQNVDDEIKELKRRFRTATTTQDYRDVGNRCVAVLEALSRTVYDPAKHLREGETEPPVDKTKQRIGRYVENSFAGSDNASIRGVATKVAELAHEVKHSQTPTRREAGIAADSVILLANILRRVDQEC